MRLTLVCGEMAVRLTGIPKDLPPERIRDYARALRAELLELLDETAVEEPALPPDPDAA